MDNIKTLLSEEILRAFSKIYEEIEIDEKISDYLGCSYFGKFDTDYKIKSLIAVQKILSSKGIQTSIEELGNNISQNMTSNADTDNVNFSCFMDRGSLNINLTNNFVEENIKRTYLLGDDIFKKYTEVNNKHLDNSNIKIMVDFSSPNIAKDMHVGHLRSTIIGDSICTLYELMGYDVRRVNHIGDFGLQFGMIIQHLLEKYPTKESYLNSGLSIADLQNFYTVSKKRFDTDPEFAKAAYNKVVQLQSQSDSLITDAWMYIKDISRISYEDIYSKLNVRLTEVGESFYQNMIPSMISELETKGFIKESDGRKIINIPGYDLPLTVQKSDGGFTYDSTDLAAIRYRLVDLDMDKVFYVIDSGQALHCELFFKVAKEAGWIKPHQEVKHIGFGVIIGSDGKKFRSRVGGTVKLSDLLEESIIKATEILKEHRGTDENGEIENQNNIIKSVAYGSLKYADLSSMRTKNYVFSYDRMISFKGNTGAYQLYEYVRICTILENAKEYMGNISEHIKTFKISEKEELNVCKMIMLFPEIVDKVKDDLMFHTLCTYLYDLSNTFSTFHIKCRCIYYNQDKKIQSVDYNRLIICVITKNIIGKCFDILGISKINKM